MAVTEQTLSSGYALGLGLFTAINLCHCAITIPWTLVNKRMHLQV